MKQLYFIATVTLIASLSACIQYWKKGDNFLPGDCVYYAHTAVSLLQDGDFDLSNQLEIKSREDLRPHEGFFAVSPDGRVVPKHSTLMPMISIPFVELFGIYGFLLINVLFAIALVIGVAYLAGYTSAARIAAVILFITSSWLGYCYNYSPDLFVAALIVWAYALARRERWLLVGLLAGLAVWAKIYAAVILLPLAIVILPVGWRATLRTLLGALPGIAAMLIINAMLYGGPFITGYDRDGRVTAEGFELREHYSLFNQPFLPGLVKVLFDRAAGMIRTAPLWFLWPLGLWFLRRERWAWAAAFGAIANVCFFAPYEAWNQSIGGNRFLFPAVALGGALLAPLLQRLPGKMFSD